GATEEGLRLEGLKGFRGGRGLGGGGGRSRRHREVHGRLRRESRLGAQSRRVSQIKLHDAATGAALAALGGVVLWHIQGYPAMPGQKFGPAWFPGLIAVGLIICGALLAAQGARTSAPLVVLPERLRSPRAVAGVASVIGGLVFYVLAADALGFYLTALLIQVTWMRLLGASWRVTIPVATVATVVIHLSFYKLLRIPLPWGIFE